MDPVTRRSVWDCISRAKKGRVIILTTHSMEEADILGDRVAIMSGGKLTCIGSSLHLKNKVCVVWCCWIFVVVEESATAKQLQCCWQFYFGSFFIFFFDLTRMIDFLFTHVLKHTHTHL